MVGLAAQGRRGRAIAALCALALLVACQRHSEEEARTLAAGWFDLGETLAFESRSACTAAVFRVKSGAVKSRLPLFDSAEAVLASGRQDGPFALSVTGKTADQLFIDLMNAHRPTGVAIQAVGLSARPCMDDRVKQAFFSALNADPSVVVFSRGDSAFAVLDPVRALAVFTGGDM